VRDALSPQLPGWLDAMGARLGEVCRVTDTLDATVAALEQAGADLVITTGGTARGPADHVRAAVGATGGRWVVDGVRVRPGHPMKLAQLADGRPLVALPGNPLAAVSGLVTLAWPLIARIAGRRLPAGRTLTLAEPVDASPGAHRLVPARVIDGGVHPSLRRGPAMLSGISEADGLVVVEPGPQRAEAGGPVTVLPLPWGRSG
jgi:molybdopterin molybdotransferase